MRRLGWLPSRLLGIPTAFLITRLPLIPARLAGITIGRLILIGVRRLIRHPPIVRRRNLPLLGVPASLILALPIGIILRCLTVRRLPAGIPHRRRRLGNRPGKRRTLIIRLGRRPLCHRLLACPAVRILRALGSRLPCVFRLKRHLGFLRRKSCSLLGRLAGRFQRFRGQIRFLSAIL